MERVIEPEWLDELPADEPSAVRSRDDLQRLNALMNHVGILAGVLRNLPRLDRVLDIGCGDGSFALKLARKLDWRGTEFVLLDQNIALPPKVCAGFAALECPIVPLRIDALAGLERAGELQVVMTNLFLHHFEDSKLRALFRDIASRCEMFVACEPRRSALALGASQLVGLIGCNRVTRHDAVASVRAGFRDRQISRLWPTGDGWSLNERAAGLFSHLFIARQL